MSVTALTGEHFNLNVSVLVHPATPCPLHFDTLKFHCKHYSAWLCFTPFNISRSMLLHSASQFSLKYLLRYFIQQTSTWNVCSFVRTLARWHRRFVVCVMSSSYVPIWNPLPSETGSRGLTQSAAWIRADFLACKCQTQPAAPHSSTSAGLLARSRPSPMVQCFGKDPFGAEARFTDTK